MSLKSNTLTDLQLLEGCIKNDISCQKQLFDKFAPKMLSICKRYARHEMEAEDIVQDAFIKVFRHIKSFKSEGSFEGWIRRIVVNTALKHVGKNSFKKEYIGIETYPDRPYDPEVFSKLGVDDLLQLIEDLPHGYRMVFNLYVIDGYSHAEISKMLDIGESTSRSQLVKARRVLQEKVIQLSKIAV